MPLDAKQLESFARGPRPGADELANINLDDDVEAMADADGEQEPHEEIPGETDEDDKSAFPEPLADFVHALEQHAEDIDELALELTDDQLDAPSEEPGDEDKHIVLDHAESGELDPELLTLAKAALPDLDIDTAEQIGEHLVTEGMLEDSAPIVAYLLVLASVIDQIEVGEPEATEESEEEELPEEEPDEDDLGDEDEEVMPA